LLPLHRDWRRQRHVGAFFPDCLLARLGGFGFVLVPVPASPAWILLLHDMSQLMRQQFSARLRLRVVHSGSEGNLVSDSVGLSGSGPRGGSGRRIRMYPHPAEIVAEALLEVSPRLGLQRIPHGTDLT
jgi:hypothetical protein